MTDNDSLIHFPCHFPIKIIGKNSDFFDLEIFAIIRKHFPDTPDDALTRQESKQGHYLSLTATVFVHDQQTLDALYQDLTKHPDIKMVL